VTEKVADCVSMAGCTYDARHPDPWVKGHLAAVLAWLSPAGRWSIVPTSLEEPKVP